MKSEITKRIRAEIVSLSGNLKEWAEEHGIEPKLIELIVDLDEDKKSEFWLVTDDTGHNDSSYRIAFNAMTDCFGLECRLEDGKEWYMGDYGSFAEAVQSM